jgi:hypothetical protein
MRTHSEKTRSQAAKNRSISVRRASDRCNSFDATMSAMAKRIARQGGRRSLGPRDLLGTRLPVDEADHYRDLADQYGRSNSDFIAELLRIAVRHIDEFPTGPGPDQKELPLKAS